MKKTDKSARKADSAERVTFGFLFFAVAAAAGISYTIGLCAGSVCAANEWARKCRNAGVEFVMRETPTGVVERAVLLGDQAKTAETYAHNRKAEGEKTK